MSGKTLTLSGSNNWKGTFSDLPKNNNGTAIAYTVKEKTVAGYTPEITGSAAQGYVITNTHTPETTSVPVEKVWSDNNNQDRVRPDSITVQLLADGEVVSGKTLTLSGSNNWKGTFSDLPKNNNGTAIAYTVKEKTVAGYTPEITGSAAQGYVITNTHTPEKTSVSVNKAWNDSGLLGEKYGYARPDSITVQLKANNEVVSGKTLTLSESNNWGGTFSELPKYSNGTAIEYSVSEVPVSSYTTAITGSAADGFVITNTPKLTSIEITKNLKHNGEDDTFVANNATFYVALFSDAERTKLVEGPQALTFTEGSSATTTFTNLPIGTTYYVGETDASGKLIGANQYGTEVMTVDGEEYIVEIGTSDPLFNAAAVTGETNVTKAFDNILNDIPLGYYKQFTITKAVKDSSNREKNYTGTFYVGLYSDSSCETLVGGLKDGSGNDLNNPIPISLNNESSATVSVQVPELNTKYYLAETDANGKKVDSSFEFYPTFSQDNVTVTDDSQIDVVLTNIELAEAMNPVTLKIKKIDEVTENGLAGAVFEILKDDEQIGTTAVTGSDGFTNFTFTSDGTYTVKEKEAPKGYQNDTLRSWTVVVEKGEIEKIEEVEGIWTKIYNLIFGKDSAMTGDTLEVANPPEKTSIPVEKVWKDDNNRDGKRPNSITVKLLADEKETGKALVLDADNNWSETFTELDAYRDGKPVAYTVEEVSVKDYTSKIIKGEDGKFIITNTHTPEKISVGGTKTWNDKDLLGKVGYERPSSITVQLKADGEPVESKTVTADDDWEYEFENLYKYDDGKEIKYSVEETAIDGNDELLSNYDVVYDGNNIKNTPRLTSVEITKNLKHNSSFDEFVAKDATFYVALFSDADRTKLVAGPQELNFRDASKAVTTFNNLPVGKTYYVGETDSEGNILGENENGVEVLKVDDTEYIVEIGTSSVYDFNAKVETVNNETASVEFDNILNDIPLGYYKQFTLTKKVVDVEGNPMKYTGSFYVTLFEDEKCTKPATMDGKPIMITLNDESEKTVVVETPDFGLYYLAETDANGKKVDSSFKFVPTFSSTTAKITDDADVSIELTNQAKAEPPVDNSGKDMDGDVKTGDSTNIMLLLAMMITSIMLGIVILLRARRKEVK